MERRRDEARRVVLLSVANPGRRAIVKRPACLNNGAVSLSANLGTNICLRGKQALPGSAINRIIKQTLMSWISANYDKICFGIWRREESELSRELRVRREMCVCVGGT